jgi:subtilase family serine protease
MGKDFRQAYAPNVTLTGTKQVVGLVEFDGYYSRDITTYQRLTGLPKTRIKTVLLDNFNGTPGYGNIEVALDIDMAMSMAPGLSQIIVYEAGPYGNWHDMLNRMATDNAASQLSCSWYSPGAGPDPVADQIFQQMAAQGQSFYNASGDYDAYTGLISFPADNPYITQVGGTTLTMTPNGGAYVSETVWNWGNGIGSGGGISTSYALPAWQAKINFALCGGSSVWRNVPDVALIADNVFVVADNGFYYDVGGTSCAAPLWAGFTSLVNQQALASKKPVVGFLNPTIYALGASAAYASAVHDITTGDNTSSSSPTLFFAVTGYDLCTGWGTPNGQALVTSLLP